MVDYREVSSSPHILSDYIVRRAAINSIPSHKF
jgi:hypothetical protein